MAGRTVASLLLLVSVTFAKPEIPLWAEARTQETGIQETQILTIENVQKTEVTTIYHTVKVYPTCTTTVSGVSACAPAHSLLPDLTHLIQPTKTDQLSQPLRTAVKDEESHSLSVVEMVLPSCDCVVNDRRIPRLLRNRLITIWSTTTRTVNTVITTTEPSTTVSITYDGCVPTDALTTTACSNL
ncbi:uncharacterized protein LOC121878660 [Homarus americanus]|uniref:Uncharacterized protein n=1 Tax=Homarus americanus TaxID=6706 RepID=A0A8J5MP09_HOMAM|nr:uncharacterized protein LOC121878660 [Homarus americanus]KAG7158528.1 hypothetical protein Hamer_G024398 [Homarus americanus]